MQRDWQRGFYLDLEIKQDATCSPGWEPAYEHIFNGLDVGCDCSLSAGYEKIKVSESCSAEELEKGC